MTVHVGDFLPGTGAKRLPKPDGKLKRGEPSPHYEVVILTAILEAPARGPIHLMERLEVRGRRVRPFLDTFWSLVDRGFVHPPQKTGMELYNVPIEGRRYLDGRRSLFTQILMRGELT